jgi:3-hydroxyisobutyrate dehydrogenase
MVAYLGTGLLGANFVRAMLQKGVQVQVWNRTIEKAKALEQYGAKVFSSPAEAVKGCSRVHLTVSDDAAVDEILELAKAGFEKDVIILDHTTTSAEGAAKRSEQWKERGYSYLHAPVFMGPQNALEGTGSMMASGDKHLFEKVEQELAAMTGKLMYLGERPDKAACTKLLGNLFLICMTGAISDTLALAKALDIPGTDVLSLFEFFNPANMVIGRTKAMMARNYDEPTWELNMARKDARLMMEGAQHKGVTMTVIPAIAQEMDKQIKEGNGKKNWTIFSKDSIGS